MHKNLDAIGAILWFAVCLNDDVVSQGFGMFLDLDLAVKKIYQEFGLKARDLGAHLIFLVKKPKGSFENLSQILLEQK